MVNNNNNTPDENNQPDDLNNQDTNQNKESAEKIKIKQLILLIIKVINDFVQKFSFEKLMKNYGF